MKHQAQVQKYLHFDGEDRTKLPVAYCLIYAIIQWASEIFKTYFAKKLFV